MLRGKSVMSTGKRRAFSRSGNEFIESEMRGSGQRRRETVNARERRIAAAKAGLKQALTDLFRTDFAAAGKTSLGIIAPWMFETLKGRMMTEFEIEMRARIMLMEAVTATMLAHTAALTADPRLFTAQVMDDVEHYLERELDQPEGEAKTCAPLAMSFFQGLSQVMLAHVTRHAAPAGRG